MISIIMMRRWLIKAVAVLGLAMVVSADHVNRPPRRGKQGSRAEVVMVSGPEV